MNKRTITDDIQKLFISMILNILIYPYLGHGETFYYPSLENIFILEKRLIILLSLFVIKYFKINFKFIYYSNLTNNVQYVI